MCGYIFVFIYTVFLCVKNISFVNLYYMSIFLMAHVDYKFNVFTKLMFVFTFISYRFMYVYCLFIFSNEPSFENQLIIIIRKLIFATIIIKRNKMIGRINLNNIK